MKGKLSTPFQMGRWEKAGNLIDSAAAPNGPSEFNNVKLEEAVKRIAEPFGLSVRSDIDRRCVPKPASALSRKAHVSVMPWLCQMVSATWFRPEQVEPAPGALSLPGNIKASNVKASNGQFTYKDIIRRLSAISVVVWQLIIMRANLKREAR